jgi:diacylglycerol kinase (ATP)
LLIEETEVATAVKRIVLVHSTGSGWGDLSDRAVVKALEREGRAVDAVDSKSIRDGDLTKKCDLVIAAGGDGTVLSVARRLAHSNVPMAVLPVGTANNLARTVGIASRVDDLLELLESPDERGLDLGVASGSWGERFFSESAGIGWFCDALGEAIDKHDKPIDRALARLSELLAQYKPRAWELTVDGKDLSGTYAFVDVMNARMLGPNLCFAPDADPFDGWFDVVLATQDDLARAQAYLEALRVDPATPPPTFDIRRAKHVHFSLGAAERIRVDGTTCPKKNAVGSYFADIRVLPAAVRWWLPRTRVLPAPSVAA